MSDERPVIEIPVRPRSIGRFRRVIGDERYGDLDAAGTSARASLDGARVWNLSSTANGGGVAELLECLLAYVGGIGIEIRWLVVQGDAGFFDITKRLHNRLHGFAGDAGSLDDGPLQHYEDVLASAGTSLRALVRRGDVVLLHDPQTVGLAPMLRDLGATVVWRCHVGVDRANDRTDEAWAFLRPYLGACQGFVFSRASYVPPFLPLDAVRVITPSIDPFSPKNRRLRAPGVAAILAAAHLVETGRSATVAPALPLGASGGRPAVIYGDRGGLDPTAPLVTQISRWDHLKDMVGVLEAFASYVPERAGAQLALVGPDVASVSDDPEGLAVLGECVEAWSSLPAAARRRICLATLPMEDATSNALMVNALQRRSTIVVQKSLAEGFGLTVAEAMWKRRPVVASAVGGIIDQIAPDAGVLLEDPTDLEACGRAITELLGLPTRRRDLGQRARARIQRDFVGDLHLIQFADLVTGLLA